MTEKQRISAADAQRAIDAYENGGYEEETYGYLLTDLLTHLHHLYGAEEFDVALAAARAQYKTEQ